MKAGEVYTIDNPGEINRERSKKTIHIEKYFRNRSKKEKKEVIHAYLENGKTLCGIVVDKKEGTINCKSCIWHANR